MIDEVVASRLKTIHEEADLTKAEERMKSGWYAAGPYRCLGPGCGQRILKPRLLKVDGKRRVTLSWCSQPCHDAWLAQFHLPGPHWGKYDANGVLIGYVVPKEHFISIDDPRLEGR